MSDNTTPYNASKYDKSVRQTIPFYEVIQSETIDLIKSAKPDVRTWLDTGCGTGYLVERAWSSFPLTQFILADPSPAMLEQAQNRMTRMNGTRIRFLPPVTSNNLSQYQGAIHPEVITAIQCHHYLREPRRQEAVRACYALLAEKGLFVTFENVAPLTEAGVQIGLDRWRRYQVDQNRTDKEIAEHLKRYGTEYFPISAIEHIALLKATGFSVVELFWYSHVQAGFYAIK